jgi:hypothetical protein
MRGRHRAEVKGAAGRRTQAEFEARAAGDLHLPSSATDETLEAYARPWLKGLDRNLKASRVRFYRDNLQRHVLPLPRAQALRTLSRSLDGTPARGTEHQACVHAHSREVKFPHPTLPHYRIGAKILVKRSEFDAWAARFRATSSSSVDALVAETLRGCKTPATMCGGRRSDTGSTASKRPMTACGRLGWLTSCRAL